MIETKDICITFDTTGSMYPCLTQVRNKVVNLVDDLFSKVTNLRIAIIAHGDYCDGSRPYITKILDFTDNQEKIIDFVKDVEPTHGGDSPECYELVLYEARTKLNWHAKRSKVIVMIGDDEPHDQFYSNYYKKKNINWHNETDRISEDGIIIYGIHAMPGIRQHSKYFYEEISRKTNGLYLTLDMFSEINELLTGICYRQEDDKTLFNNYSENILSRNSISRGLKNSFRMLQGLKIELGIENIEKDSGLNPVESGRFQMMNVINPCVIKEFVERQGVEFKPGRGFYELTKPEKVQRYKEIILMNKNTGDLYSGNDARQLIGLGPQDMSSKIIEKLKPISLEKYIVFVQSTSFNRKLISGTRFLYEVPDWKIITSEKK